ncbi:MAG TPA: hypothetical protein VIK56_00730 [Rhodoferax sp.]
MLPLTTGTYLAVRFSSFWDLPTVIHIARKVPIPLRGGSGKPTLRATVPEGKPVIRLRTIAFFCLLALDLDLDQRSRSLRLVVIF